MKMIRSPEGLRHPWGLGSPKGLRYMALACPICFGASDAPMALGMNWGVLTLLGVTIVVLGSFATFFVRLVRREGRVGPAEAGPHTPAKGVEAGFSRPDTAAGEPS